MGYEQENYGEKFRVINVDYVTILADLVMAVQTLSARVATLAGYIYGQKIDSISEVKLTS